MSPPEETNIQWTMDYIWMYRPVNNVFRSATGKTNKTKHETST